MADNVVKRVINAIWGETPQLKSNKPIPRAYHGGYSFSHSGYEFYDGEKNQGEIGAPKTYLPHHQKLRARSWQFYIESEITQLIIKKFALWIVGNGLKLQADPNEEVLKSLGITLDEDIFSNQVESLWKVHSHSKYTDHTHKGSLHKNAAEAWKHSTIGGDVLVVLRVENKIVTTQVIDGVHIQTPIDQKIIKQAEDKNNRIVNGVEINAKGQHVAYYVSVGLATWQRVEAVKNGRTMAYMVYGMTYRADEQRGIPLISAIMETVAKIDRYKDATVGSAEERQKIAYYIYHELNASGENPLKTQLAKSFGRQDSGESIDFETIKENIVTTTQKATFNMPPGSKLGLLESKNELYFADFITTNLRIICAACGIPMEVALSWYDSNYSASRAALKDWEHKLKVEREYFANQFYKPYYDLWLEVEVFKNSINAPGLLGLIQTKDYMGCEAYKYARFTGANIPHIDPMKEVQAERLKLGNDRVPLTTIEAATEAVNGGDFNANQNQYRREQEQVKDLNEEEKPEPPAIPPTNDSE